MIHAATLVTAGVYLLVRSSPILEYSPTALLVIVIVGTTTLFVGALSGLLQNDLKRIVAFSTISQLGYMFLAIGLSQYHVALFHVINHAAIKATIFLAAGAIIHAVSDQQDVRKLGGLINFLPFVYSVLVVATLSLIAIPGLTGFFSKDLIIELSYASYSFSGTYGFILGSITAGLTAFYSFRLIMLVFYTSPNANVSTYNNVHESNWAVIIPLIVLALISIAFGYVFSDAFVGVGSDLFGNSIFVLPGNMVIVEAEFALPIYMKLLPTILTIVGATLAIYLYTFEFKYLTTLTNSQRGKDIYTFINQKAYLDIIINRYIIGAGLSVGYAISKVLDRGTIEMVGPHGVTTALMTTAENISQLDTGNGTNIPEYSLYIVLSFAFLLLIVIGPVILSIPVGIEIKHILLFSALAVMHGLKEYEREE